MDDPISATCVKVEGPGRIMLAVFEPHRTMYYKPGVHWAGDDRRTDTNRPFRRNGVWKFPPYSKQRDAMKYHQVVLAENAEKARLEEERVEQDQRRRAEQHEQVKQAQGNGK